MCKIKILETVYLGKKAGKMIYPPLTNTYIPIGKKLSFIDNLKALFTKVLKLTNNGIIQKLLG